MIIEAADDGTFKNTGYQVLDMLQPQPYFMVREFDELSRTGTLGMPSLASAEKGERFLEAAVESVAAFIRDFATWKRMPKQTPMPKPKPKPRQCSTKWDRNPKPHVRWAP